MKIDPNYNHLNLNPLNGRIHHRNEPNHSEINEKFTSSIESALSKSDSEAVTQALASLESGELDGPEAALKAAKSLLKFGI